MNLKTMTGILALALVAPARHALAAAPGTERAPQGQAAVKASADVRAPAEAWAAIMKKAEDRGEFSPGGGPQPATFALKDIKGPQDGDHQADYFVVYGYVNSEGEFGANFVSIVSETWTKKPDDKIQVDQWLIRADLDGKLEHAAKIDMLRDKGGRIYRHERAEFKKEEGDAAFLKLVAQFAGSVK